MTWNDELEWPDHYWALFYGIRNKSVYWTYKNPPTPVFRSLSRWNISLCVPEWTPILICGKEKEAANRVPPKEDWFFLIHSLQPTNKNALTSLILTHHSRMHTNIRYDISKGNFRSLRETAVLWPKNVLEHPYFNDSKILIACDCVAP